MIDVIVSKTLCPHCDAQKSIMQKSFFKEEYRIIEIGTPEYESYDLKDRIDAVPYIVVREEDGSVKYASKGKLDGTSLHQIERVGNVVSHHDEVKKAFNPTETLSSMTGRLSRSMDA